MHNDTSTPGKSLETTMTLAFLAKPLLARASSLMMAPKQAKSSLGLQLTERLVRHSNWGRNSSETAWMFQREVIGELFPMPWLFWNIILHASLAKPRCRFMRDVNKNLPPLVAPLQEKHPPFKGIFSREAPSSRQAPSLQEPLSIKAAWDFPSLSRSTFPVGLPFAVPS